MRSPPRSSRSPSVFAAQAALVFTLLAPVAGANPQTTPPASLSKKQLEAAIETLVAIDRTAPDALVRELAAVAPLVGVPLPKESALAKLRQTIAKARAKRSLLPTKTGEHFIDPVTGAELDDDAPVRARLFIDGATAKPKGLLIGLHGGGVGSGDAASSRGSYEGLLDERGWVGLFPEVLEKTERGWTDSGTEEWLVRLVDQAVAEYGVPPDHVYMTGHSMGGYGTWVVGAHHADLFAALAVSAGAPTPVYGPAKTIIDVQRGVVPNLRNMPLVVFQSTDDPRVSPEANQAAAQRVAAAKERFGGYDEFVYWEVHDRQHDFPEGGPNALIERIEGFTREPWPQKLVWEPVVPWKRRFFWLEWAEPKLRTTVIAEVFPAERRIAVLVEGSEGAGLGLLLSPELLPLDAENGELVIELNGDEVFRGVPEPRFDTWLRTAALGDRGRESAVHVVLKAQ
jgi:pimeloyl-ACP methyl ester carboxylesterase